MASEAGLAQARDSAGKCVRIGSSGPPNFSLQSFTSDYALLLERLKTQCSNTERVP